MNPFKLAKVLREKIGNIVSAKMLRDGKMLLFCKDSKQQKAALGLKLLGLNVSCTIAGENKWVRGVITGIPTNVSNDVIKKSIWGATMVEIHLKLGEDG